MIRRRGTGWFGSEGRRRWILFVFLLFLIKKWGYNCCFYQISLVPYRLFSNSCKSSLRCNQKFLGSFSYPLFSNILSFLQQSCCWILINTAFLWILVLSWSCAYLTLCCSRDHFVAGKLLSRIEVTVKSFVELVWFMISSIWRYWYFHFSLIIYWWQITVVVFGPIRD